MYVKDLEPGVCIFSSGEIGRLYDTSLLLSKLALQAAIVTVCEK